jgi:hypothetical protein
MRETDNRAPKQGTIVDAGERLRHSIDVVCENAALVELWACALNGFAQPVPDHGPSMRSAREIEAGRGLKIRVLEPGKVGSIRPPIGH